MNYEDAFIRTWVICGYGRKMCSLCPNMAKQLWERGLELHGGQYVSPLEHPVQRLKWAEQYLDKAPKHARKRLISLLESFANSVNYGMVNLKAQYSDAEFKSLANMANMEI